MKKKIGIVTFNNAYNYGAMLQLYALQEKLKEKNEVYVINYENRNIDKYYKLFKVYGKNIKDKIKSIISSSIFLYKNIKRNKAFKNFVKSNMKLSDKYNSITITKNFPKYDIYITGSDQVWNPEIIGGELELDTYALNFGSDKIKRISYAASIGNNYIEEKYKKEYSKKLNKLDYISVREETGKKQLQTIIDKPITVTLDPTLLLTRDEWENKITSCNVKKQKPYILTYVVDENIEYRKIVNYLANTTKLKLVHFEKFNKFDVDSESCYENGPLEFIKLIRDAKYVVTTSFHATVFSILFHKQFFVIPHKKTGSRVIDLLDKLGMQNHIIYNLEEFKNNDFDQKIDYDEVDRRLDIERRNSLNWLNEAINN